MATKTKDGWQWSDEEEQQIEMNKEARLRASRQRDKERAKESRDERCSQGDHASIKDGKCSNCGEAIKKEPEKKRSSMWG